MLNLLTYPWIEEKVRKSAICIHSGYYDFVDCTFEKWSLNYKECADDEITEDVPMVLNKERSLVLFKSVNTPLLETPLLESPRSNLSFKVNPEFIQRFKVMLYKSNKKPLSILKDVSGIIKPGRLTLLLGPPGSGKTTLLKALAGKLYKDLKESKLKATRMLVYVRRGGPNYQTGLVRMRTLGVELGVPLEVYGPEATMSRICKQAIDCVMTAVICFSFLLVTSMSDRSFGIGVMLMEVEL